MYLMYFEVDWVLVSLETQVQPQIYSNQATFQTFFPFFMTMYKTNEDKRPHVWKYLTYKIKSKKYYSNILRPIFSDTRMYF